MVYKVSGRKRRRKIGAISDKNGMLKHGSPFPGVFRIYIHVHVTPQSENYKSSELGESTKM